MTALQKAMLRLEEKRRELSKLLDVETRGADFMDQLETAKRAVEAVQSEVQAAGLVDDTPPVEEHRTDSPGGVELRSMLDGANMGNFINSVMGGRSPDGVEKELQDHYKLQPNAIPLPMLELRAAATFTGDEPASASPVVPQLFPNSVSAFCGVAIEQVPAGLSTWPVLTTGVTVHKPGQGNDAAETTGTFKITSLTPKRLQGGFSYQIEDAAALGFLDAALRENLSDALQSELDKTILTRTSDGLLDKGTDPGTPGSASTAAQYLAAVYGGVDGLYAQDASEVRMLVGSGASGTYGHMGGLPVATGSDINAAEKVADVSGGLRVSGHVPAYASNRQEAVIIKGPARRNTVAAIWGITLIPDEVTRTTQGEIRLTAVMLADFAILRTDGYKRHRFRTS